MLDKLIKCILHPNKILRQILLHTPKLWPDKLYLNLLYPIYVGEKLDLNNPKTYTAKLQWLKLYDHNPEYIELTDKQKVKSHVASIIGEEFIIPTLHVWDRPEDIDWDVLPNQFVLKCNHDSGGLFVCRDKSSLTEEDKKNALKKIKKSFKRNFFYMGREWPYKFIEKKIIAEQYMEDSKYGELRDYKFFCFDGEPKLLFVAKDRLKKGEEVKFNFFDMDYNHLGIENGHPLAPPPFEKPALFDQMVEISRTLSKGFPHVRIDLYEINGKVYFGEYTLYHNDGFVALKPIEWEYKIGDMITLPKIDKA